jgi:hypothetical protein
MLLSLIYMASSDWMIGNDDLEMVWNEMAVDCPGICATKILYEESRCPGQNSNWASTEYKPALANWLGP